MVIAYNLINYSCFFANMKPILFKFNIPVVFREFC